MLLAKMPDGKPEIYGPVLQGEGKTQGKPSIFVRLSGCNLHCSWCDSYYTWNFEGTKYTKEHEYVSDKVSRDEFVIKMDPLEVGQFILDNHKECLNIVFTGGEPMMQQKGIVQIMEYLNDVNGNFTYEIETNGTIAPINELLDYTPTFNCSPKLKSSANTFDKRVNGDAIKQIYHYGLPLDKVCFKFVVRSKCYDEDMEEIEYWLKEYKIDPGFVYLMPEGWKESEIIEGTCMLEEKNTKYKVCTRLQILLHGDKRAI